MGYTDKVKPYDLEQILGNPVKHKPINPRANGKSFTSLAIHIGNAFNIPPEEVLKIMYECQYE